MQIAEEDLTEILKAAHRRTPMGALATLGIETDEAQQQFLNLLSAGFGPLASYIGVGISIAVELIDRREIAASNDELADAIDQEES